MKINVADVGIVALITGMLLGCVGLLSSLLHIGMLLAFGLVVVLEVLAAVVYKLMR